MTSELDIRILIGQASLVYERLSGLYSTQHFDPFRIERRIEAWQHALATVSDIEWQSYLTRNGWGQAQLVTLCSDMTWSAPASDYPDWAQVLADVWEQVRTNEQLSDARGYAAEASLHTLAVVTPFVDWITRHLGIDHEQSYIYAWALPRLVRMAEPAVSAWAAQRALRGPLPARAQSLTPLINDDVWRQFACQHAWLMRTLATHAHDMCGTVARALTHLPQDWLALRQHCGMRGATPQVSGISDAPAIYGMVGGITVHCADQTLVYVPQPAPQCDVLEYITTWLNRRGAQIPLRFPTCVRSHDAVWLSIPAPRTPDRHTMPQLATALGSLAALCDICGIAHLTHAAIHVSGGELWVLDASIMPATPPTALAHCIVSTEPHQHAVWPTSMHHGTEAAELWLDQYVDDLLAGYQHTSQVLLQRARDLMHTLYGRSAFQRRIFTMPTQRRSPWEHPLYDFSTVRDGFDASMMIAQTLSNVAVPVPNATVAQTVTHSLCHGVEPFIYESSDYNAIITRLNEMTRYTQLMHAAHLHLACTPSTTDTQGRAPWLTKHVPVLTSEQLAGEALQLVAHIVADQVALPTGCTWFVLPHDNHRRGIQYADAGLVDGVSGIALVLSALSTLSTDDVIVQTAARGFYHAISLLPEQPQHIGGVGYALAVAMPTLKLPHLCDVLWNHVKSINLPHMYAQPAADAIHGVASTVLAFIALHRIEPVRGWQMLALAAGERLLQLRQRNPQNERIWAGQQLSLGGFGSSGIALALIRLYELTQDFRFLRAVYDIVQQQDRHYDEQHGGWADIRSQPPQFPITWCHGTLGPALVRLALQSHEQMGQPSAQLRGLLDGIDHAGMHDGDGLCCGMAGSIDMLLSVSREFHQPYYADRAQYWMTQMIQRAHDRGGYVTAMDLPGLYQQPALMQGSAGIAYQIARCAYPRLFPSLLWYGLPRIVDTL